MRESNVGGAKGVDLCEVLLQNVEVSECAVESRVIALSPAEARRIVGVPQHYVLKDFETWGGYFAPSKLIIKVLNIVFSNYPLFQVIFEEQVNLYKEQFLLDKEDAEFEVQKRMVDGDVDLWRSIITEVWKRGGKELTIGVLLQDFIRKSLDHWALYNLSIDTTDKLTKLIHLSYQRKLSRFGTGYFDGGRARVMTSMLPMTLWATRFQRTSMLSAEIMMAVWPHISSYKAYKTTVSMNLSRFARGTLLAHCIKKLWWVTKRGVFHLVVWGGSALGTSIIAAYWYPCNVKVLDNIGLLIGALVGETVASGICKTFDGFIEPFGINEEEDDLVVS